MSVCVKRERSNRDRDDARSIRIGLVNNMPDSALKSTERQFLDVLAGAAPAMQIELSFFALPGIPRGELGQRHLASSHYNDMADLQAAQLDGLIVTGTEPKLSDLRDEPYWPSLASLFDWITSEGPSTVFSCLAAHAAVLHFDGIARRPLPRKCFGLFDQQPVGKHDLTRLLPATSKVAHSRWNEVPAEALTQNGYEILTQGAEAGVDLFLKHVRNPLLFFQGHPEYDSATLLREYQRDVRRLLAGERETYPQMPDFYFDSEQAHEFSCFEERALAKRDESLMASFPAIHMDQVSAERSPAAKIYRAWLQQLAGAKTVSDTPTQMVRRQRFAGALA